MREPNIKDLAAVAAVMEDAAEEAVGSRLYTILAEINPKAYSDAAIPAQDYIVNPTPYITEQGKKTMAVYTMFRDTGKIHSKGEDIDNLLPQWRKDMATQIWNRINRYLKARKVKA